jgi:hypothetical protein
MKHHIIIEIEADDLTQLEAYLSKLPLIYAEKLPIANRQPAQISYTEQYNTNKISYKWETK